MNPKEPSAASLALNLTLLETSFICPQRAQSTRSLTTPEWQTPKAKTLWLPPFHWDLTRAAKHFQKNGIVLLLLACSSASHPTLVPTSNSPPIKCVISVTLPANLRVRRQTHHPTHDQHTCFVHHVQTGTGRGP